MRASAFVGLAAAALVAATPLVGFAGPGGARRGLDERALGAMRKQQQAEPHALTGTAETEAETAIGKPGGGHWHPSRVGKQGGKTSHLVVRPMEGSMESMKGTD